MQTIEEKGWDCSQMYNWHCRVNRITMKWEPVNLRELMCEVPFHCLACSCHLEVLMVISIDSLLIKQLRKLLNVILVISLFTWQDVWRENSILENMSSWHLYRYIFWPISQHLPFFEEWMFVECIVQLVLGGVFCGNQSNCRICILIGEMLEWGGFPGGTGTCRIAWKAGRSWMTAMSEMTGRSGMTGMSGMSVKTGMSGMSGMPWKVLWLECLECLCKDL